MTWYRFRNGEKVAITTDDKHQLFTNGSVIVKDIDDTDEGRYLCRATNEGGFNEESVYVMVNRHPVALVTPQTRSFVVGDSVNFTCTSTGFPTPRFNWFRDGQGLVEGKKIMFPQPGVIILKDLNREDAGQYECLASNPAGDDTKVAILNYMEAPKVKPVRPRRLFARGDTATLVCEAMGIPRPKITWFKGEQKLADLSFIQAFDSELYILVVQDQDAGSYTCVATNEAGEDSATIDLEIGLAPRSGVPFYSVGIDIHANGTLPCGITGDPPPQILWTHNNNKPVEDDRFTQLPDGSLFVQKALLKDEGLYICKARNELGEKQVTAQLSITGIVVPKITAYTNTIDIPIGHEVHLSCTVTEGNPQPTLMWIKNQDVLKDGATYDIDDFGNLRIQKVQPEDAGDYTCLASNVGGNATHTMRVSVQVPPSIEGHDANGDYIVIQGNPITLPCKVTGDPRPLLQWTKDGNRIPVTDPHYLIGEDGSLNIFSADPQDTAMYACTALNVAGITTKSMTLIVHVRPTIIRDQDEYIVVIESPLIVPCIVNSVPIAAITWKKDGVVIRPGDEHRTILPDNSLEIESAEIGDVGLYECFASNVAGNASKVVSVGVQVPPRINSTGTTDQKIVVGGKPVILECFVAGDPPPKIRWQKNRVDINPFDPNNIDFILQDNGGLYIHRATPAHTATYTCIAENPAGLATRDIKLIIHEKPRIPNTLQNNTSIIEDKKAHLPCPASGVPPPTISWFKDGKPLIPDKEVKMLGDGTLEFSSAKAKDAGVYVCVATNIAGQTRYVIEFKVFVPPKFNDSVDGVDPRIPERPTVIVNNTITMSCPVSAIPPPQITWFKDGRPVNYVTNELVRITPDGRNITIPRAQLTDAGRFTCIARNIAGETEKNFDLEVLIPPRIDDNNRLDTFTVIVKRPIVLDCRVRGKPPPKITWIRDGVRIDLLDPNVRIFSQGRRIEIIESEVTHTGFYTCLAESVAGTSGKNYSVDVLVPPNIRDSTGVKRPSVISNDSIELDCTVFGVPLPEVKWYRDSLPLNTSDPRIEILENGYKLKVSFAKVRDSARYSCRAVNVAGQSEKYFDLNILVPPKITRNGLDLNPSVIVDRSVVISCPATGVPPPDIIWYRDNQLLNVRSHPNLSLLAGGRQLRIVNSKVSDAAIFTCKVVNKAGEDALDFDLQVYVPPRIDVSQISLLDMEVIVNRSVIIQCPATGIPAPEISWFHDGREIDPKVQQHFKLKRGGRELMINNVQVDDSGRYVCRATNPAGTAEQMYHLNVLVPPRIDDTNLDRSPQIVVNRSITLQCPAYGTPPPDITWLRNGIPLLASGKPHIRVLNGGKEIKITRAAVTDSARYTCIATNKAGTSDIDFDMDIIVPPSIDGHIDTNPQVIKGRTMILNCPASGIPFPNITWMVNRNPIVESQRFKILAQGRQLEIISTMVVDSNRYTCVASNAAGQASKDFNVEVIVPPTIDEANLVDNPRVISNRTVILECPVSGTPPPTIKWLKDGVRLVEKKGLKVLSAGRQVEILHAAVIDTGRYTCIAANDAGELRRTFGLEVLVPPQIDDRLLDLNPFVIQNRSVYIDCPVTSIPQPSFLWSKNGQPLFDFPYPNLKLLNNGRQIHVVKAQVSDAGDYTCLATNVAGQLSRTFKLEVLIPPKFNGSGETLSLSVIKGHSVAIVCPAIGTPPPTVLWFRDGLPLTMDLNPHMQLQDNDRILKILSSRVVDRARYACRAHNPAGEVERYFNLDVLVPPRINGSEKIQEMSVIVNRGTVISCPASGIPAPNIDWYWEGKRLTVLSNPNLRFLSGGRQLQIISAQLLDIGQYKCVASNQAGNASKEFILGVMVPPTIEDGPPIVQASLHARTLLLCETLGLPEPDIQWEKSGERIPNNGANYRMHRSGSLEFSSVTLEDSGNYRCTATNEAGAKFRDVRLEVQVPPTILSPSPYEVTVAVDSSGILPCKTSGAPKPRITWQKGTSVLNGANGYSVETDGSLVIQKAGLRDAGIYICIAQNNAGTALGQVRLEVEVPPKIEDQQKDYTVIQDREIILPCRSNGVPTPRVYWEKDGNLISQSDFRYRVLRSGWLAIPITRTQDTGRYKCIAENNAGKDTIEIALTVQVPPHIEEAQRIFTVIQGDEAHLLCRAKGVPPPAVIWYRDGRRIAPDDPRFKVLDSGSLQFADVQRSDGGSYICSASNQAGRDTEQIILRVQVPPSFTRIPQDQEVNANGRIELECAAEGIPIPVVSWQKNGTVVPSAPSINGRSRLKIEDARKEDGGTYVCVAMNPAGSGKVIAAVFVKVPPRVLNLDETRAVTLAEKVVLHCPVSGDPPLTIIWMKNGRTVQMDNRISQLQNGSLVIYDSVNSDAGEYKCVVTNDAGSSEGTATLTVQRPPDFSVEPKNTLIGQGETTIFNCVASGEPKPSIRWQKGRVRLSSGDRLTIMPNNSLRIVATQLEDAGVYVCIARNSRGSILVQAELTVQVHGGFSTWSAWGDCSVTCGQGTQFRSRTCDNPAPLNGGRNCNGGKKQSQTCFVEGCQTDGQWGEWGSWEECSMTCGEGERVRTRKCDSPAPAYGGEQCVGAAVEKAICNVRSCPIDGNWGTWSQWGGCSVTCGQGTQERHRRCDSPQAQHGGRKCPGSELERRTCTVRNCETDGNWGQWQQWSSCTFSCGGGTRQRVRLCNSPPPSINGRFCPGEDLQKDYCNSEDCPVHGNWAAWGSWGECSATCGGGSRKRFRTCSDPSAMNGGRTCAGEALSTEQCSPDECPVDSLWNNWGLWSACSVTCGEGTRERSRTCTPPKFGGQQCLGDGKQVNKCQKAKCAAKTVRRAIGSVLGNINDRDFGISQLIADVVVGDEFATITAKINKIPKSIGPLMQHLVSILTPIYWTSAKEIGGAANGFTLTKGHFDREVQVEFATGEILRMTHVAQGIGKDGNLDLDIIVTGYVPDFPGSAKIAVEPYTEEYIQTGPGSIYAYSSRIFRINGHSLPYAWNHSISYDTSRGKMPFLVESLQTDDITVLYDVSKETLEYQLKAFIMRGDPSNRCPDGFNLNTNGPYCEDSNECRSDPRPCSHYCHNSPGSFSCSCPFGLTLGADGKTCKDINECDLRIARCHQGQECINTAGSYRCAVKCGDGFRRTSGGLSCQDINECQEEPNVCDQQCLNRIGSYRCACRRGYRLIPPNRCVDVDECALGSPCSHLCANTAGSYRCSCPAGYRLIGGQECRDIDECSQGLHDCEVAQECRNTLGGFTCVDTCPNGLKRAKNGTCVDIDECALSRNQCFYNQICVNTVGSYHCKCPIGYISSGAGQPCVDYDECQGPNPCQHQCRNTRGSYVCTCPPGYRLNANGRHCDDIDECEELNFNCGPDKKCNNVGGDFECVDHSCPKNYDRDPVSGFCVLECDKAPPGFECPVGSRYADILDFKEVSLPNGIPAYQDLIRLIAYNQFDVHLPRTTFTIIENHDEVPFGIRIQDGKGIVYTLEPLEHRKTYTITVRARSFDHQETTGLRYQTTFILHISVSAFPY
ncbi:hemicentin-1-like isoform X2 [Lineus longissimus]|uniref:hemicentin-1-like isoform X2 n=1 Tax=Lineus longissimus TaxID=88925 RepID=UPI00315D6559